MFGVSLALGAAPAFGGESAPSSGTILQTIKEPVPPKRPDAGIAVPAPRPRMEAPPGIKVKVRGFRISGNTLFTEAEIQPALAEFASKELDFDGLSEAVRAVTSFYRGKGYFLAQAYLPKQELSTGVVEIHVLEGRLGKVNVKQGPSARLKPWIAEGFLRRIEPGAVATESGTERPLLLLGDLPATTVQSTVGPGANVGEADLTVEIGDDGRRISGNVEVENFGNKFAGAIRFSGQVYVNNALGIGDQLVLRGLLSQDELTEVVGFSYSMPISFWGTRIGFSASQMRYDLGGSFSSAQASGEGDLASLLIVHPFVRTRDLNLFGQLAYDYKELEDRIDSVQNLQQRRIKAYKVGMFGDSRDFLLGGGLNTFSATVTAGENKLLGDAVLIQNDPIQFREAGNFTKVNLEVQRVQRVTDAVHGVFRFGYQSASKNLASAEKISVGGPYGVRAYPVGEGLSDEAVQLTLEGRYTLPGIKLFQNDITLAGFIDGAHVKRFRNQPTIDTDASGQLNANTRTFWGAGVGVRFGKPGSYSLTADLAWRVGSEEPSSDVGRHPRFWMRGVVWF